jgi:hypothetical protein
VRQSRASQLDSSKTRVAFSWSQRSSSRTVLNGGLDEDTKRALRDLRL